MIDNKELCETIKTIYPDVTACSIDVEVTWDDAENAYAVDLETDKRKVRHYLPAEDAELCMQGTQCASLGLEIGQFKEDKAKQ
jgi:hypothetical protein